LKFPILPDMFVGVGVPHFVRDDKGLIGSQG
jgi:hypothetical protein